MDAKLPEKQNRLVNALADARKAKGMSQSALAKALGTPQSFVSKYEHGQRQPDIGEFLNVCRVLDVNPLTLMIEADLITRDDLP